MTGKILSIWIPAFAGMTIPFEFHVDKHPIYVYFVLIPLFMLTKSYP